MPPLTSIFRYVDNTGNTWHIQRVDHGDGDISHVLTTPDGVRRPVRRELVR